MPHLLQKVLHSSGFWLQELLCSDLLCSLPFIASNWIPPLETSPNPKFNFSPWCFTFVIATLQSTIPLSYQLLFIVRNATTPGKNVLLHLENIILSGWNVPKWKNPIILWLIWCTSSAVERRHEPESFEPQNGCFRGNKQNQILIFPFLNFFFLLELMPLLS